MLAKYKPCCRLIEVYYTKWVEYSYLEQTLRSGIKADKVLVLVFYGHKLCLFNVHDYARSLKVDVDFLALKKLENISQAS